MSLHPGGADHARSLVCCGTRSGVLACGWPALNYSDDPAQHVRVTGRIGSHARTRANTVEALRRSISLRAGPQTRPARAGRPGESNCHPHCNPCQLRCEPGCHPHCNPDCQQWWPGVEGRTPSEPVPARFGDTVHGRVSDPKDPTEPE